MNSSPTVSGSENLEVMVEARNYNAYLLRKVGNVMAGRHRILDFGAGRGTFAIPMRDWGHEVVCVEPERVLRSSLTAARLEVHASLDTVPSRSLEGVYTLNVLEHIQNDKETIAALYRKLARGGIFYAYVPAFQLLYSAMDDRVGHVRRYRLGQLIERCRQAGFKVHKAGYSDSLGFLASLVYKTMGSADGSVNRAGLVLYDRYAFPLSCVLDIAAQRLFGKNAWIIASNDAP